MPTAPQELSKNRQQSWCLSQAIRLVPFLVIVLGFIIAFIFRIDQFITLSTLNQNQFWLKDQVNHNFINCIVVYTIFYAIITGFSIPGGLVLTIIGGFLFGSVSATIAIEIGATTGATLVFIAVKRGFGDHLLGNISKFIEKFESGFKRNAFFYMLSLRLMPAIPFFIVNIVPGFLGVSLRTYIAATIIGILPATWVYTQLGEGLADVLHQGSISDPKQLLSPATIFALVALGIAALLPILFTGKNKKQDKK